MNTLPSSETFPSELQELAHLARVLAHPARLLILRTLARRNACICGEIVQVLPLSQSTVSRHLKELKEAGLIRGEIEGVTSCYCLDHAGLLACRRLFAEFFNDLELDGNPPTDCC